VRCHPQNGTSKELALKLFVFVALAKVPDVEPALVQRCFL
jgi:hypothetical protein